MRCLRRSCQLSARLPGTPGRDLRGLSPRPPLFPHDALLLTSCLGCRCPRCKVTGFIAHCGPPVLRNVSQLQGRGPHPAHPQEHPVPAMCVDTAASQPTTWPRRPDRPDHTPHVLTSQTFDNRGPRLPL